MFLSSKKAFVTARCSASLLALILAPALYGGDINVDINDFPCIWNPVTGVNSTANPGCSGPIVITKHSGSGDLISFDRSTVGNAADPFILSESMTGMDLNLMFSGGFGPVLPLPMTRFGANPIEDPNIVGQHRKLTARIFDKSVTNDSAFMWTTFYMELQTAFGTSSGDQGLSFGETLTGLVFMPESTPVSTLTVNSSARDALHFSGLSVAPGDTVSFKFMISDNLPSNEFFLLQRVNVDAAGNAFVPEPSTIFLMGTGIGLLFLARRRLVR